MNYAFIHGVKGVYDLGYFRGQYPLFIDIAVATEKLGGQEFYLIIKGRENKKIRITKRQNTIKIWKTEN